MLPNSASHKVVLFDFDPLVFDYDTDEEGNILVSKPFTEFDMAPIGQ